MDVVVTVVSVSPRTTSRGRVIYDIKAGSGEEFSCWDAKLANDIAAAAPAGPLTLRYDEKRNGQFVNKDVREFAPNGLQLGPDQGPQMGGGGRRGGGGGGMSPDDKTRVSKLGAQSNAAQLVSALYAGAGPELLEEAIAKTEELAKRWYSSARSHEKKGEETTNLIGAAQPNLVSATPQQVAASVPGVQVGTSQVETPAADGDKVDWD